MVQMHRMVGITEKQPYNGQMALKIDLDVSGELRGAIDGVGVDIAHKGVRATMRSR